MWSFDEIDRSWLLRFVEHRIGDRRILRLLSKWLGAGVMEEGEWRDTLRGTPQGSIVSPILANIYLHYVLDLWFQRKWRARIACGDTLIVRYADDFVVGFQHKRDAERFLCDLKDRLATFSLELHPEKTRLIEFGKFALANRRARGERRPETFDFLGFTHYCRTTRKGRFGLGRKPIGKRVNRTLKRIKAELRRRMHHNIYEVAEWLGRVTGGWLRYYAVPTSFPSLQKFVFRLKRMWLRVLRRRSHGCDTTQFEDREDGGRTDADVRPKQSLRGRRSCCAGLLGPVAEGPLYMEQGRQTGRGFLAFAADHAPMADHAVCRQAPKVGAPCPSGLAGICAGGVG